MLSKEARASMDKFDQDHGIHHYAKDGSPMSMADWVEKTEGRDDYRRIGYYQDFAVRVSTVWLGIDHGFTGGDPVIFETMVFPRHSMGELACERWATLAAAEAGHKRFVKQYRYRIDLAIGEYIRRWWNS